jgi:hypothetical protein
VLFDYINLNEKENISTAEDLIQYYQSGRYQPNESSEDLFLMTSLMIILNTRTEPSPSGQPPRRIRVAQLPFFTKVVRDIK